MTRPWLTSEEQEAMRLTGLLAQSLRAIIGNGPNAAHDWTEMTAKLHDIQHAVLAQAAARAYPAQYRLLGHSFGGKTLPETRAKEGG